MTNAALVTERRIFGTEHRAEPPQRFDIGPWSFEVKEGSLATVWADGAEAVRGIGFIARDGDWGSPVPVLGASEHTASEHEIAIAQSGRYAFGGGEIHFDIAIVAASAGALSISARATAHGTVQTNRTGFVVLHPIAGIAGAPLLVTHADGTEERSEFPAVISPSQPVFDIVALEHDLPGGARVRMTFEGGTWEMEDQRNWSDASYKTYFRSLLEPFPYTLSDGDSIEQRVTLELLRPSRQGGAATGGSCAVTLGAPTGETAPAIAVSLHPDRPHSPGAVRAAIDAAPGSTALVWMDLTDAGRLASGLEHLRSAAAAGAAVQLEVLFPDDAAPVELLARLARAVAEPGVEVLGAVGVPNAFLASYQPSADWPGGMQPEDVVTALRASLPDIAIGYGMLTYFTELNRRPPRTDAYEFISHATCAIVHDGDDRAVMQTLEAIAQIAATARAIAGPQRGYHLGPSLIGMRSNPYGQAPIANPDRVRRAMALEDPRHGGLFAAAFALGVAAAVGGHGVDQLCLCEAAGPLGLGDDAGFYPVFHVVRGLARGAGAQALAVEVSDPARLAALGFRTATGTELWIANLTPEPVPTALGAPPGARAAVLDADAVPAASASQAWLDRPAAPVPEVLGAYAVARIVLP